MILRFDSQPGKKSRICRDGLSILFIVFCDSNTFDSVVKSLLNDDSFPSMHFLACGFIATLWIELHITRLILLLHNIVLFLYHSYDSVEMVSDE